MKKIAMLLLELVFQDYLLRIYLKKIQIIKYQFMKKITQLI